MWLLFLLELQSSYTVVGTTTTKSQFLQQENPKEFLQNTDNIAASDTK
jgi:hypothetical protein